MFPVLKVLVASLAVFAFLALCRPAAEAQSTPEAKIKLGAQTSDSVTVDGVGRELLARGKAGWAIQEVRAEVLTLLAESNSCSAWFTSADPAAREKFQSLRFDVDESGANFILRKEATESHEVFYHPYVARTLQDVGPGSTITINANGAFFRASAFVRDSSQTSDRNLPISFKFLTVGNYSGGSPEARLLTVLHEFGHIVDLLPVDADVPAAPFISVRNTDNVLRHCQSQIRSHARHLRATESDSRFRGYLLPAKVEPMETRSFYAHPGSVAQAFVIREDCLPARNF